MFLAFMICRLLAFSKILIFKVQSGHFLDNILVYSLEKIIERCGSVFSDRKPRVHIPDSAYERGKNDIRGAAFGL